MRGVRARATRTEKKRYLGAVRTSPRNGCASIVWCTRPPRIRSGELCIQELCERSSLSPIRRSGTSGSAPLTDSMRRTSAAIVSGAGTGTAAFDADLQLFTEMQVGSYALMDVEYGTCEAPAGEPWRFRPALFVASATKAET